MHQRKAERREKLRAMLDDLFGPELDGMFEIQALSVVPAKQRQGCASALVEVVHGMVSQVHARASIGGCQGRFTRGIGRRARSGYVCRHQRRVPVL